MIEGNLNLIGHDFFFHPFFFFALSLLKMNSINYCIQSPHGEPFQPANSGCGHEYAEQGNV